MVGAFSDCWRSMVWGIVLLEESKRMIDMQAYGRVIGWLVPASILSHMFKYGFFFTCSTEVKLFEPCH
jgi:hypothetical protein